MLPPDGFVTGDQGSKFLQARAFADKGPLDPGIDVRARDLDPAYRYQEPKLKARRGRLVSEFLWLLPLTTAPFLALAGLRGLYVVPAIATLVIFIAAAALGRRLGEGRGIWSGWIAVAATPVIVYGLELWEHAPAAACAITAAVWLAPGGERLSVAPGLTPKWRRSAAAGAAVALGALFREEVVMALPALLIARAVSAPRERMRDLVVTGAAAGAGAAVIFAAMVPVNLMIYGAPLPMHMTQDAWNVAISTPYLRVRRDVVVDLLLPYRWAALFVIAAAGGLAAASMRMRAPRGASTVSASRDRTLLACVHAAVIVMLIVGVVAPIWRLAHGIRPHDAYRLTSVAHTWPFALAVLYWPWTRGTGDDAMARYLLAAALLLFAGAALVIPTSGGSQWSPRFLLAAAPLLAVVAAAVAVAPTHDRPALAWMARAVLAGSMLMQATGVLYVQRTKARDARITHALAERTTADEVVASDVFWVPQIAATLAPGRRLLFAWTPADVASIAARAAAHGIDRVAFVSAPELTGYDPPDVLPGAGSCHFTRRERVSLGELGLMLHRYACDPR